jgi:hypothetical protein
MVLPTAKIFEKKWLEGMYLGIKIEENMRFTLKLLERLLKGKRENKHKNCLLNNRIN